MTVPNEPYSPAAEATSQVYDLDIARNDKSTALYIVNKSAAKHRVNTVLDLDIPFGQGVEPVLISGTWLPQDMSAHMPKEVFLQNPAFLTLLRNGSIELVHPNLARRRIASPQGVKEAARLAALKAQRAMASAKEDDGPATIAGPVPEPILKESATASQVNPALLIALERGDDDDAIEAVLLNSTVNAADVAKIRATKGDVKRLVDIAEDRLKGGDGLIDMR